MIGNVHEWLPAMPHQFEGGVFHVCSKSGILATWIRTLGTCVHQALDRTGSPYASSRNFAVANHVDNMQEVKIVVDVR